jgi:hypothetical protein
LRNKDNPGIGRQLADNPGIGRQLAVKHRDHRIAQRILTRIDHCHAASREAWMLLE